MVTFLGDLRNQKTTAIAADPTKRQAPATTLKWIRDAVRGEYSALSDALREQSRGAMHDAGCILLALHERQS